jgi:hypothetical protein
VVRWVDYEVPSTILLPKSFGLKIILVLVDGITALSSSRETLDESTKKPFKTHTAASAADASGPLETALSKLTRRSIAVHTRSLSRRVTSHRVLAFLNHNARLLRKPLSWPTRFCRCFTQQKSNRIEPRQKRRESAAGRYAKL